MACLRVLVTRPAQEAPAWVDALRAQGYDALAWPLIDIAPVADPTPLRAAWERPWPAAMFVSGNAVRGLAAARPLQAPWPARCWAPGPGTAAALREAGVAADAIDMPPADGGRFDSETLWQGVQAQVGPGFALLVVRGADAQGVEAGRDWLGDRVRAAGGRVETVAAYRRLPPQWLPAQAAQARAAAADGSVWLFSSSEAIANLCSLLPGQDWAAARCVATHARIAATARRCGFGRVAEATPDLAAVVASIESAR